MYFRNNLIILILIFAACLSTNARDIDDYERGKKLQEVYSTQTINPNSFDKNDWNTLKKKVKIKDYKPKKKNDDKEKEGINWLMNLTPETVKIIQWILFGILFSILLFLILKLLGVNPFYRKADRNKINISLDEIEENLDTAAIDPYLYEAIKTKNYKLAIRLYYLMIIQRLALKEKIIWKKYKTNKHYLHEIRKKEEYPTFKKLTLIYERSWFGEGEINEDEYNILNSDFVNFLQNIK